MNQKQKTAAKKWFWVTVLSVSVFASGCGRKSPGRSSERQHEQQDGAPQAFDLSRVSMAATDIQMGDPAVMADQISGGQLVLRAEQYTNQNDSPVMIWVHLSGSANVFGICNPDRAQYQTGLSTPIPQSQDTVIQPIGGGWVSFELASQTTATIEWVVGGNWAWIPGPQGAPARACNQSYPQRGWAAFHLSGVLSEQARVSASDIEPSEATADERDLEPSRVWILPSSQDSLDLHWGG